MEDWEKLSEMSLPEKEDFCSYPDIEDVTDTHYRHVKRICKYFEVNYLDEKHELYVQNDTLLLADVFNNFWDMCIQICRLDPAHFLSAPRYQACQANFENTKVQ